MNIDSPSILRQKWIEQVTVMFKQHFKDNYWLVPENVRMSIGFPVGQRDGKRILGICHTLEFSQDNHWEIFISPEYTDTKEILETIAHELVHATVAVPGHRGKFKACALAIGFEAPMTFTPAGPKMLECIERVTATIGQFPAGILNLSKRKKQATNMKKCECMDCGYIAYATRKWINGAGAPVCPVDAIQMICDGGE